MADSHDSTASNDSSADSGGVLAAQKSTQLHFTEDEEFLIARMYNLVGERWSLIAGRIPGRTAKEIEWYWNSRYSTSQ